MPPEQASNFQQHRKELETSSWSVIPRRREENAKSNLSLELDVLKAILPSAETIVFYHCAAVQPSWLHVSDRYLDVSVRSLRYMGAPSPVKILVDRIGGQLNQASAMGAGYVLSPMGETTDVLWQKVESEMDRLRDEEPT